MEQREPSCREHPSQSVILTTRVAPRLLHKLNHLSLSFTLYKRVDFPQCPQDNLSFVHLSESLTQSPVAGFSLELRSGAENCLLSVPQSKLSELTAPDFEEATPQTQVSWEWGVRGSLVISARSFSSTCGVTCPRGPPERPLPPQSASRPWSTLTVAMPRPGPVGPAVRRAATPWTWTA